MKIKIKCRLGTKNVVEVEMDNSEHLYDLLDKLVELGNRTLSDEETKFTYNEKTYSMNSRSTFEKIGMKSDTEIMVFNQAISGIIKYEMIKLIKLF